MYSNYLQSYRLRNNKRYFAYDHSLGYQLSKLFLRCGSVSHDYENEPTSCFHCNTIYRQIPLEYHLAPDAHVQKHATSSPSQKNMPSRNTSTRNHDENEHLPSVSAHLANDARQTTRSPNAPSRPFEHPSPELRQQPPHSIAI